MLMRSKSPIREIRGIRGTVQIDRSAAQFIASTLVDKYFERRCRRDFSNRGNFQDGQNPQPAGARNPRVHRSIACAGLWFPVALTHFERLRSMKHRLTARWARLIPVVLAATSASAVASSHREAPFITELPKVDATDFYMFTSYETGREDFVTIVANYIPFQVPYGGPNFFQLDPEAKYEIKIDQD